MFVSMHVICRLFFKQNLLPAYDHVVPFQLMVGTATGVLIHPAVQPVGEGNRLEQGSVTTPPHSTREKAANGLDQQMKQEPAIPSTVQVSW